MIRGAVVVRVCTTPSFCTDYFGGGLDQEIEAGNLFQLVDALERLAPGFSEAAGTKVAFAVNGIQEHDWTAPLPQSCEVLLVPRIAGG